jgi:hypothetical protein
MSIRRPLSPGGGWVEVSLYRAYADLAREHLTDGRYFDAIVVSCVGFDVLVNTLPDRIRLHHYEKLTPAQQKVIGDVEASPRLPAGPLLTKLRTTTILHWRLDRALEGFNQERNNVIHPTERQQKVDQKGRTTYLLSLKAGAVVPHNATREQANRYFRYFCHVIDLSGGESPLKQQKVSHRHSLSRKVQRSREKRRWGEFSEKDERD